MSRTSYVHLFKTALSISRDGELLQLGLLPKLLISPASQSITHKETLRVTTNGRAFSTNRRLSSSSSSSSSNRRQKSAPKHDDYYRRLLVTPAATAEEIKSAFFRLSKKHHPDVNQSEDALDTFLKIREAYDVLGDETKRKDYDKLRGIKESDRIVEDMFPPNWRERRREMMQEEEESSERGFSFDDVKAAKRRHDKSADEHKAYQAQQEAQWEARQAYPRTPTPEGANPIFHVAKLLLLEFKAWIHKRYLQDPLTCRGLIVGLIFFAGYQIWFHLPKKTRKLDEFRSNAGPAQAEWLWSDFAKRWKWRQNLDRLPEMVEAEKNAEKELLMERYRLIQSGDIEIPDAKR